MVARAGRGWRLAPSLVALEDEANGIAPRRSTASDGSLGDQAHRARASDHNPSGGFVHAIDITHDPANGMDAHGWGQRIAERRDGRVKYLISRGRIWQPGVGWSGYGGANRHDGHLHLSVHHTDAARDDLSRWLVGAGGPPQPIPPAVRPAPPAVDPLENLPMIFATNHASYGTRVIAVEHDTLFDIACRAGSPSGLPVVPLAPEQIQKLRTAYGANKTVILD
jgi:hypothetical protein